MNHNLENTKLLQLFKSLRKEELRRLNDFVASPFFNKNREAVQLCTLLVKAARRGFSPGSVRAEALFRQVYPNELFNGKQFAHLTSKLLKLCEQFLAQLAFEQDGQTADLYLLEACSARDLEKSFRLTQDRCAKALPKKASSGPAQLYQRYWLSNIRQQHFMKSGTRKASPYLQDATDHLDAFYFTRKMRLSCAMLNNQLMYGEPYTIRFAAPEFRSAITELPNPALAELYDLAYRLLQTENQEVLLHRFRHSLRRAAGQLDDREVMELLLQATNYCIRQIRSGYRNFIDILVELYQEGLENGYFLENGIFSPWNYKNIVKLGLGLRRLDWVESIVETYTPKLPAADQHDAYHFNRADISYHRKDYANAQAFLQQTEFTNIHYALGAKTMLIKIYYETGETEALYSLLSSFYLFLLLNKKIGEATKSAYLNFIRFTKRLPQCTTVEKREDLQRRIRQAKDLSDQNWLLSQLLQPKPV